MKNKYQNLMIALITSMTTSLIAQASPPIRIAVDSAFYPTAGQVFTAIPISSGDVLAPVIPYDKSTQALGIQVFSPINGSLSSKCISKTPSGFPFTQIDGLNLYPDGKYLGAAAQSEDPKYNGLLMLKTSDVVSCSSQGYSHFISQYVDGEAKRVGTGDSQFNSAGSFAFVRNEYAGPLQPKVPFGKPPKNEPYTGVVGVTNLDRDASGAFTTSSRLLSEVSSGGNASAGLTLSKDGTRLYMTAEVAPDSPQYNGVKNKILTQSKCTSEPSKPKTRNGVLTVIDVAKAEAGLGEAAVITRINAACTPTRIIESLDGKVIWIAARGNNLVLAFSRSLLESDPEHALIGYSKTYGKAPVGLALLDQGQLMAVANSNRYSSKSNAVGNLTILDVRNPKHVTKVKTLAAGQFPRDVNVGSDDRTIYLANYGQAAPSTLNTGIGVYTVSILGK